MKGLKKWLAHRNKSLRYMIYLRQNIGYVVQAIKVLRNLVLAETNAQCPKTPFCAASLNQTQLFCRDWELMEIDLRILYFISCKLFNMYIIH